MRKHYYLEDGDGYRFAREYYNENGEVVEVPFTIKREAIASCRRYNKLREILRRNHIENRPSAHVYYDDENGNQVKVF